MEQPENTPVPDLEKIKRLYKRYVNCDDYPDSRLKRLVSAVKRALDAAKNPDQRLNIINSLCYLHAEHILCRSKKSKTNKLTAGWHYIEGKVWCVASGKLDACCAKPIRAQLGLMPLGYRPEWPLERELSVVDLQFFERFKHNMPWPDVVYVAAKTQSSGLVNWLFNPNYSGFSNLYTFTLSDKVKEYLSDACLRLASTNTNLGLVAACILDSETVKSYVGLYEIPLKPEVVALMGSIIRDNEMYTQQIRVDASSIWYLSLWISKGKKIHNTDATATLHSGNLKGYRTAYLDSLQAALDM